ncbi:MAG: 3,4-dihydroxyphenylacetate 2,3-dioxygenase [Chloroflexota bacterium]
MSAPRSGSEAAVYRGRPEAAAGVNVIRASHGEFRVTDLEAAHHFYVDLLGFVETERTPNALYLRGYEDVDHHCLALRRAERPGAGHLAYQVERDEDLDRLERLAVEQDLPHRWVEPDEEPGLGRALRLQDPVGLPLEFFASMDRAERLLQRFDRYRGAQVMRFDHFNCQVPEVNRAYRWYAEQLGFACSEYTATDDTPEELWAVWLHRKQNVHDLALMNGTGPRVHHLGFWLADQLSVLRACDILAGAHMEPSIERGPGRHGISNAFFLYLRDPDGNRIEFYANDYLIADPNWKPLRWSLNDPRRQTFWGHAAPSSWFEEASLCESVISGELTPVRRSHLLDRPEHVT